MKMLDQRLKKFLQKGKIWLVVRGLKQICV